MVPKKEKGFEDFKEWCQDGRSGPFKENECHRFSYVKRCSETTCPVWHMLTLRDRKSIRRVLNDLLEHTRDKNIYDD